MAGQIAAVHRRDVSRVQRAQGLRVVPVVKVAAMAFQAGHAGQAVGGAFEQLPGRDVAEIVRRQIGQQRQPHIGRRGAMRQRGGAVFLVIVRRQPVVIRADESLEISPGLARDAAKIVRLFGAQARHAARQRQAEPPGDGGGEQPEQQNRPGQRQRGRIHHRQPARRGDGQHGRERHGAQYGERIVAAGRVLIAGGLPFQQPLLREQQTTERAQRCIQAVGRFMRQRDKGESGLQQTLDGGVRGRREMLARAHVVRFAQHIQQAGKHRRDQQNAEHRQGPEQGRGKQRPAEQQHQRQCRRRQAAAQVIQQLPA